jgi:hypothetical protein
MSNGEYRIVKNTYKNGRIDFSIDKMTHSQRWANITIRNTIADARSVIEKLVGDELVSSEVVE